MSQPGHISEILFLAADIMDERPWYTASVVDPASDAVCAAIAIETAAGSRGPLSESLQALIDYLGIPKTHNLNYTVFRWNDAQASKEAVIAALRSAGMARREKEWTRA